MVNVRINNVLVKSAHTIAVWLEAWWARYAGVTLPFAVVAMGFVGIAWLGYEFFRLLWQPDYLGSHKVWPGAIDLKLRYRDLHAWFSGIPTTSVYPPATYLILWPFLGWLPLSPAVWFWGITSAAALGWLVFLLVKESGATRSIERVFVALMPLSMYATGATIGNGQLMVHILPALMGGILLLRQKEGGLTRDCMVAVLIIVSFMKPSVTVPFFWIVLFAPGTVRPAVLVCLGYAVLTFIAGFFQEAVTSTLLYQWLAKGSKLAVTAGRGHANVHIWLAGFGLGKWILPVSLVILLALGFWTYCHRRVDLWLLMGITAIIARFWAYHRWYDDLLILLPMVALFRAAKRSSSTPGTKGAAGGLLAITLATMMAPGGFYLFPLPWKTMYVTGQIALWIIVLLFLAVQARRERMENGAKTAVV